MQAANLYAPALPFDREANQRHGQMLRNEHRLVVRSGELTVGVLARATHGQAAWTWFLTGLPRPDDPNFVWQGHADNEQEAVAAFKRCWQQWLGWAGLEQVDELSAA
jgi:hypothetical protein